jgi:hypothetical protein
VAEKYNSIDVAKNNDIEFSNKFAVQIIITKGLIPADPFQENVPKDSNTVNKLSIQKTGRFRNSIVEPQPPIGWRF